MTSNKLTNILLSLSIGIFLFGTGFKLGEYNNGGLKTQASISNFVNPTGTANQVKNVDLSLFWDTWNKVEAKFVDRKKIDRQKMIYGATKGMVAALDDPYTFFLTPDENKVAKNDLGGKFEGIGAQLGLKDNHILVISPIKKSPAEKAGIRAGDIIVKVDGVSTKGWTLFQAVGKIRGKKGTSVQLGLERGGEAVAIKVTRDEIHISSVELTFQTSQTCAAKASNCPNVAVLRLNQFGESTNDEWDEAVAEIQKKWQNRKIKGMVLDLRGNPGGYLDSSVYLASEFLPDGRLVVKQESSVSESRTLRVTRNGKLLDIPLTVLIDKGSASAAEILSGALRDYKRAKLIGEKSFGKGSVQEVVDLKDGAGVHVTIAKWILPNGDWINGRGIEPDIKVELKIAEGNSLTKENDTQLEKAITEVIH